MSLPRMLAVALLVCVLASHLVPINAMCPFLASQANLNDPVVRATGTDFNAEAVEKLDWEGLKQDLEKLLKTSQDFWPADDGYYGGLMVRLAWHCAGSYRTWDGRGGCDGGHLRFFPELGWEDNTNLDKARRLLVPLKLKYGNALSWGDLITMAGTVAIEAAGGPKLAFCAGRIDDPDGTTSLPLGPTKEQEEIAPCHQDGNCSYPLGQSVLGLIYVNPEGLFSDPDPETQAYMVRRVFGAMGWSAQQIVALSGGHNLGKTHGACPNGVGPGPDFDLQNPWVGTCGSGDMKGKGPNTFTSGFEGPWTDTPSSWSNDYYHNLLNNEWEVHIGPGAKHQWRPANSTQKIMMLTSDISLLHDDEFKQYVELYAKDAEKFNEDFAKVWYELLTRDMGPVSRCLGPYVPTDPEVIKFQCPLPSPPQNLPDFEAVASDIRDVLVIDSSEVSAADTIAGDKVNDTMYWGALFTTLAYQCASSFRATDYMGGCNGAYIRFAPEKDYPENAGLEDVLKVLQPIKDKHDGLSWADLIVLSGTVALQEAGIPDLKFCGGRVDAEEPCARRAEVKPRVYENGPIVAARDNIAVSGLTPSEGVALAARPRSPALWKMMGYSGPPTKDPSQVTNNFFKVLAASQLVQSEGPGGVVEFQVDDKDLYLSEADLALTWEPTLNAIVQEFATNEEAFKTSFSEAWTKLMNADRFDGPDGNVCGMEE